MVYIDRWADRHRRAVDRAPSAARRQMGIMLADVEKALPTEQLRRLLQFACDLQDHHAVGETTSIHSTLSQAPDSDETDDGDEGDEDLDSCSDVEHALHSMHYWREHGADISDSETDSGLDGGWQTDPDDLLDSEEENWLDYDWPLKTAGNSRGGEILMTARTFLPRFLQAVIAATFHRLLLTTLVLGMSGLVECSWAAQHACLVQFLF